MASHPSLQRCAETISRRCLPHTGTKNLIDHQPRAMIRGPAGTGKTLLAQE